MLRLQIMQNEFVLLMIGDTKSNIFRKITRVVQFPHAVDKVLLFL